MLHCNNKSNTLLQLLLNGMPWRRWAYKSHPVLPAIPILAERRNRLVCREDVSSLQMAGRTFRWLWYTGHQVVDPANTVLSYGMEDTWFAAPLDTRLDKCTARWSWAERPCLGAVGQWRQRRCKLIACFIESCRNTAIVISRGLSWHLPLVHIFCWSPWADRQCWDLLSPTA